MEERRKSVEETANQLSQSLKENTTALNSLRRRYRWVAGVLILSLALFGYEIKSHRDSDISTCREANEIRHDLNDRFQAIADNLEEFGIGGTDQERKFLDLLSLDLDYKDCSEVGWF